MSDSPSEVDALVQLSFAVMDAVTRAAAEHELSPTQVRLLGILRDRSPSMAAIADRLRLDRSSVSGLIDRAEARGLVARRTSADDARVTLVDLTELGGELAARLEPAIAARIEPLLATLPAADRPRFARLAWNVTGPHDV